MVSKPIRERIQLFERLAEQHIVTQSIEDPCLAGKNISWDILRTDLIHPICPGNKFFKLKYYLQDAIQKNHTRIFTYGGPWSNHIVASAFAAHFCGLASTGYIRGEMPQKLSETLLQAKEEGMKLEFLPRSEFPYPGSETDPENDGYSIPQGGYGILGAKGAGEMLNYAEKEKYTHICCACGTGTMLAGLISTRVDAASGDPLETGSSTQFVGIAALNDARLQENVEKLIPGEVKPDFSIHFNYHFGGYAKKTESLITFMNSFYQLHHIPTDFVYTAKLMFGIRDLVNAGFFPPGSRLLAIHSGGLQGNKSLKNGMLIY
jgi:1-aminocyclopropane-1-carboxylate deaminase/D-cysteine desulfhydrase-like pyridoxal-dependent ACC family enzyme